MLQVAVEPRAWKLLKWSFFNSKKNPTKTKWPIQALLFLRPPAALRDLHSVLAHSPPPHLPQPCHQSGSQPPPTRSYHANTANTSTLANSSCGYFPSSTALLNLKKHDQTEPGFTPRNSHTEPGNLCSRKAINRMRKVSHTTPNHSVVQILILPLLWAKGNKTSHCYQEALQAHTWCAPTQRFFQDSVKEECFACQHSMPGCFFLSPYSTQMSPFPQSIPSPVCHHTLFHTHLMSVSFSTLMTAPCMPRKNRGH